MDQGWLWLILLSFVWSISLRHVDSKRQLFQTPPAQTEPWLSPTNQPLPTTLPPRPSLIPRMPGSIPPSSLPTWPTSTIPPLPSFPWNIPSPPPYPWNNPSPPPLSYPWNVPSPPPYPWSMPSPPLLSFPWNNPSPPPPTFPWTNPSPTSYPWSMPSHPPPNFPSPPPPTPPSFPWTNITTPLPTIPFFPWTTPSPPPPLPSNPTFPWSIPSPPPPPPPINAQTFPWLNLTNPFLWNSPPPPPPNSPSFPWSVPSPLPPSPPSFPWNVRSPPPPSFPWSRPPPPWFPWQSSPPPPYLPPWLQSSPPPPLFNLPWLNPSPPTQWYSSPFPPFGLPPGNSLFPTGIQFTFSNFTQDWLPEAGVKVTWSSIISVELSLQLFVAAIMKPITLIITAIQDNKSGPGAWEWRSGLADSKLGADVGALCTTPGGNGFPERGIVVAQTPIDGTKSNAITWFTLLFNNWSENASPIATLDHTLGSFGGFVSNTTMANLKTFCSHPESLSRNATKQGLYVLT